MKEKLPITEKDTQIFHPFRQDIIIMTKINSVFLRKKKLLLILGVFTTNQIYDYTKFYCCRRSTSKQI